MAIPRIHFTRQQIAARAGLDEDTVRYWIRLEILRPAHGGGGKGRHLSFSRLELGLAVTLAALRNLGLSSTALAGLAACVHAAIDWMEAHGVDPEHADQVDKLIQARVDGDFDDATWSELIAKKSAESWFDLPPSAVKLARRVPIDDWRRHYDFYSLLTHVALMRPTGRRRLMRLSREENGDWRTLAHEEHADAIEIDLDALSARLWSSEP